MKAAVFHGPNMPLSIEDVELDKPQDREVLIKTVASGVCHSDLHFVDGLYPYAAPAVLGHEAAGIVEEVGKQVTYVKPGDHVICCLSVFCGTCARCMSGHPNLCSNKCELGDASGDTGCLPMPNRAQGRFRRLKDCRRVAKALSMADKINDLIHFLARLPECSAGNLAYLTARTALPET